MQLCIARRDGDTSWGPKAHGPLRGQVQGRGPKAGGPAKKANSPLDARFSTKASVAFRKVSSWSDRVARSSAGWPGGSAAPTKRSEDLPGRVQREVPYRWCARRSKAPRRSWARRPWSWPCSTTARGSTASLGFARGRLREVIRDCPDVVPGGGSSAGLGRVPGGYLCHREAHKRAPATPSETARPAPAPATRPLRRAVVAWCA